MDTSEYGLGAALIQSGCPIAFTSKTGTDVQTWYANIKRECLSVCFGLKKFHTYLYIVSHCSMLNSSQEFYHLLFLLIYTVSCLFYIFIHWIFTEHMFLDILMTFSATGIDTGSIL